MDGCRNKKKIPKKYALGAVERQQENSITNNNNKNNDHNWNSISNTNTNTLIHRSTINNRWEYWMRLLREMKGGQPSGIVSPRLLTSEHRIRYIIQRETQKSVMLFCGIHSLLFSPLFLPLGIHFFCFAFVEFGFILFWFGLLICGLSSRRMVKYVFAFIYLNDNGKPLRSSVSFSLFHSLRYSFGFFFWFRFRFHFFEQWIKQQDNRDIEKLCDKSNNNNNKIDQNGITAVE